VGKHLRLLLLTRDRTLRLPDLSTLPINLAVYYMLLPLVPQIQRAIARHKRHLSKRATRLILLPSSSPNRMVPRMVRQLLNHPTRLSRPNSNKTIIIRPVLLQNLPQPKATMEEQGPNLRPLLHNLTLAMVPASRGMAAVKLNKAMDLPLSSRHSISHPIDFFRDMTALLPPRVFVCFISFLGAMIYVIEMLGESEISPIPIVSVTHSQTTNAYCSSNQDRSRGAKYVMMMSQPTVSTSLFGE
jgi:hypothetical protein